MFEANFRFGKKPKEITRYDTGDIYIKMLELSAPDKIQGFKRCHNYAINSPIFMSPATKLMNLASQVNINILGKENDFKQGNALYKIMAKPNPTQSWTEFISAMVLHALSGLAILYIPNERITEGNPIHLLNPNQIDYNDTLIKKLNRLLGFSDYKKQIKEIAIKYTFNDGTTKPIPFKELRFISFYPLNTNGNFFDTLSVSQVVYKVLLNANEVLDAEYVTTHLSKKAIVSSKKRGVDDLDLPMGGAEKEDIEQKVRSNNWVTATNKEIEAKRLVESKTPLGLLDSYKTWANVVEDMLGVSPDIGAFARATYNNKELATGSTIEFGVKPILEKFIEIVEECSDLKNLELSFKHMSFNQIFEERKDKRNKDRIETIIKAKGQGLITEEEAKVLTKELFNI